MYSVLCATQRPLLPTLLQSLHGKSNWSRTASRMYKGRPGNMASGAPIETHSQVRLNTWQRRRLYNPGVKDTAKRMADGEVLSCTMRGNEDGNVGEESAIKKVIKFNQLFCVRVLKYPISGVFTVLCPGGTEGVRAGEGRNRIGPLA